MPVLTVFLRIMSGLFAVSGIVLMVMAAAQLSRERRRGAATYLALMALADIVAAGFYYFSCLIS
jgi:hypothetical protein